MLKHFISVLTCICLIAIGISSCKKDDVQEPQSETSTNTTSGNGSGNNSDGSGGGGPIIPPADHQPLDSVNFVHCFQPGSYWIYRNDSTGVEDSVYVSNSVYHDSIQFAMGGFANGGPVYSDYFEMHVVSLTSAVSGEQSTLVVQQNLVNHFAKASLDNDYFCYPNLYVHRCWHELDPYNVETLYGEIFPNCQVHAHVQDSNFLLYFEHGVGMSHFSKYYPFSAAFTDEPWTLVRWNIVY